MRPARPSPASPDRLPLPIHPPLVAAFFVLFLFAQNAPVLVVLDPLWLPLVASVALGLTVLAVCWMALHDWLRAGLLASWLLILFFTFGHASRAVANTGLALPWLIGLWVVLALLGMVIAVRAGSWIRGATRFLNLLAGVLVIVNAVSVAAYGFGGLNAPAEQSQAVSLSDTSYRPDIYYVVLDRYANSETLREVYGYDNSAFLAELRARGFAIADDAWANHFKTAMSLSSSMNMDYLQTDEPPAEHPAPWRWIPALLRGHRAVPDTLTAAGYTYVHIGNWWEPSATNVAADEVMRLQEFGAFAAALYQTSALSLFESPLTGDDDPETLDFPALVRTYDQFGFDELEQVRVRTGPTYAFAHILVPHPPYVFNADGSFPTRAEVQQRGTAVSYVEQLKYTNTRVLQAIDHLLDVPADQKPVIVLMADEGPFPDRYAADQAHFNWLEATPLEVQQKFGILNALYLPGGRDPADYGFTNRTSPVNEFRIVFNAIFDANLPILPDLTYLSPDQAHLYDFVLYPR